MHQRFSTGLRLCGILLLVLVVSPITAPFSTCDLLDLFGDPAPGAEIVLQSKPASSDPVPGLGGGPDLPVPHETSARPVASASPRAHRRPALQVPLRI